MANFVNDLTNFTLTLLISLDKASQSHVRQTEILQVGQALFDACGGLTALLLSHIYELHDGLVVLRGLLCHRGGHKNSC